MVRNRPDVLAVKLAVQEALGRVKYSRSNLFTPEESSALASLFSKVVMDGPFKGMIYEEEPICSEKWPKLLGSYEAELAELIEELIERQFDRLIDIGCAEGYYAVGFATRCPKMEVVAADPLAEAGARLRRLAAANSVLDRVEFHRFVSPRRLSTFITASSTLILMDCEGSEIGLLRPDKFERLQHAEILVEVHDFASAGMTEELIDRFEFSHNYRIIEQQKRDPGQYRCLSGLDPLVGYKLLDERRPRRLRWLHLSPRRTVPSHAGNHPN